MEEEKSIINCPYCGGEMYEIRNADNLDTLDEDEDPDAIYLHCDKCVYVEQIQ